MAATGDQERLEYLTSLDSDHARKTFFRDHSELRTRAVVESMADEVVRLLRIDLERADQLAHTAIWLAEELDDDYCLGRSTRAAANVTHLGGDQAAAAVLYEKALEFFERSGLEKEAAITRSSALRNLVFLGQHEQAFKWAATARKVFEQLGDNLRLARLELNFANILFRQDRWEEAYQLYKDLQGEFWASLKMWPSHFEIWLFAT